MTIETKVDFRVLSRVPRSVTSAYQFPYLTSELPKIAQDTNADAVMSEQIDFFAEVTGKARPDGLTHVIGERERIGTYHAYKEGPDTWAKVIDWKSRGYSLELSDRAAAHQGNFMRSYDIPVGQSEMWDHFEDLVHRPAGVEDTVIVNYGVPLRPDQRLLMGYVFSQKLKIKEVPSRFEFDFVTTPFAIVWLYRFDVIGEETMRHWLAMIAGLTPAKLFLIRELVASRRYNAEETMRRTGLTKRNLENHIYQLSEMLDEKVPRESDLKGYGAAMVDIVNNFGFLSFSGRPSLSKSG